MSLAAKFWIATLAADLIGVAVGFHFGNERGINIGYAVANSEHAARASEHNLVMQKVGLCAWARVMADDVRCKQELP